MKDERGMWEEWDRGKSWKMDRAVGIWGIPSLQITGSSEGVIRALRSIPWALIDTNHLHSTPSPHRSSPSLALRTPPQRWWWWWWLPLRLYRSELLNQAFSSRPRGGLLPMIPGSPCSAGCHPNMSGKTAAFVICQRDRCGFHTQIRACAHTPTTFCKAA